MKQGLEYFFLFAAAWGAIDALQKFTRRKRIEHEIKRAEEIRKEADAAAAAFRKQRNQKRPGHGAAPIDGRLELLLEIDPDVLDVIEEANDILNN